MACLLGGPKRICESVGKKGKHQEQGTRESGSKAKKKIKGDETREKKSKNEKSEEKKMGMNSPHSQGWERAHSQSKKLQCKWSWGRVTLSQRVWCDGR